MQDMVITDRFSMLEVAVRIWGGQADMMTGQENLGTRKEDVRAAQGRMLSTIVG
jgi:hypothetical protein